MSHARRPTRFFSVAISNLFERLQCKCCLSYWLKGDPDLRAKFPLKVSSCAPGSIFSTYKVLEAFTAVEATSPPAEVHDRDA